MDFKTLLGGINIALSEEQLFQFDKYVQLLVNTNQQFNLTSITDLDEIYIKHFYDSVVPSIYFNLQGHLADIGSGAGFPGIPLKIINNQLKVTLIESNQKKCQFLNRVIEELELDNINVINTRIEQHAEQYDYVIARALAPLNILCELALPITKVNGHFIAMKGSKASKELEDAKNAIYILKSKIINIIDYKLPNGDFRTLIDIKKISETPTKYPRGFSQIKHKPL